MKLTIHICLLLISISCSSVKKKQVLIGHYESKTYTVFQRIVMQMKNQTYVLQSNLELNNDSTYTFRSCGNIISGTWQVIHCDTLVLYCTNNKFRNDSLNKVKIASCGTKPSKYEIMKNGELRREYPIHEFKNTGIDCLVKCKN